MNRFLAGLGAVATVLALALTACSAGHTVHGRVTGKTYLPGHTVWTTQTRTRHVCTTTHGRKTTKRTCSSLPVSMRRVPHHAAACWQLELDNGNELCVTAAKWHHTRIGDVF